MAAIPPAQQIESALLPTTETSTSAVGSSKANPYQQVK